MGRGRQEWKRQSQKVNASEKQSIATSVQTFILNEAPVKGRGFWLHVFLSCVFQILIATRQIRMMKNSNCQCASARYTQLWEKGEQLDQWEYSCWSIWPYLALTLLQISVVMICASCFGPGLHAEIYTEITNRLLNIALTLIRVGMRLSDLGSLQVGF